MASIQKTTSGTWQVRYKDPRTSRHRAKTFKKKIPATKFLHEVEHSITAGTFISSEQGAVDLPIWVQQHLDGRADIGVTTRNRTQNIVDVHIRPRWSGISLSAIKHSDVQAWVKELLDSGQSIDSAKKIVNTISSGLDAAVRDRRLHTNPARGARFPKSTPKKKIFLNAEQVEKLATATFDGRQKVILYTLAYTGLRWGELAGLRVQDFDPLRRRLNIEQTIVDDRGKLLVKPPKTHEIRSVPVPAFLAEMISMQVFGSDVDELIFTAARGGPMRNRTERRWFNRVVKEIGIAGLTPHKLRHTAASMAISAGASVLSVQRMLGHSSATVTLNVYSSLFEDDLDEVAERLDSMRTENSLRDSYATLNV